MSNKIKNGDLPTAPLTGDAYTDFAGHLSKGYGYNPECLGMTKRETIAMHLHASLLSAADSDGVWIGVNCKAWEVAIREADKLLAGLEATKQ